MKTNQLTLAGIDLTDEIRRQKLYEAELETLRLAFDTDCTILLMLSGGKDSIASHQYLRSMGIPDHRFVFMHHLVDGAPGPEAIWDWPCTTAYCEAYARLYRIPILFSYRDGGIQREMYRLKEGLQSVHFQKYEGGDFHTLESRAGNTTRRKFPALSASLMTRWCSSVVKIDVASRVITAMYPNDRELLVVTGERREESTNRAGYDSALFHKSHSPRKKRTVMHWRPVLDLTEKEVWELLEKENIQPHPAYELAFSRTSCRKCIFLTADFWATLGEIAPETISQTAWDEKTMGHTLYHGRTIDETVAAGKSMRPQVDPERWRIFSEASARYDFKLPIQVKKWILPAGAYRGGSCGSV